MTHTHYIWRKWTLYFVGYALYADRWTATALYFMCFILDGPTSTKASFPRKSSTPACLQIAHIVWSPFWPIAGEQFTYFHALCESLKHLILRLHIYLKKSQDITSHFYAPTILFQLLCFEMLSLLKYFYWIVTYEWFCLRFFF